MYGETYPILDEFFGFTTKEQRNNFFRIRTADQMSRIWTKLAKDSRLTLAMVFEMEQPYQAEICWRLVGNPAQMINPSGRQFMVEPTEDAPEGGIMLSNGTEDNERQFIRIAQRQIMPAGPAINAIYKYGPDSPYRSQRGMLREVTEADLRAEDERRQDEKTEVNALASQNVSEPEAQPEQPVEQASDKKSGRRSNKR